MKLLLRYTFFLFLFLGVSGIGFGQRKLPYPIILVHGWTGSDETWNKVMEEFQNIGLNVDYDFYRNSGNGGAGVGSRLDYCLNYDYDRNTSNIQNDIVSYYNPLLNGNNDVFVVNFDNCRVLNLANVDINGSNQSAITKQGSAVGMAVQRVLSLTGADKVILMGHSMGGLAIREYLQNSSHWYYSTHRVAKLVTNATPHGGSDSGTPLNTSFAGYDQRSEAVRDMRTTHPETLIYNQYNGVYLFGGWETISYIHRDAASNAAGLNYRNLDVNCNGQEGNYIVGLNQRTLANDIPYSNIIGTYFGTATDNVVSSSSANMNNRYSGILVNDVFTRDVTDSEYSLPSNLTWHSSLAKQKIVNVLALDEPSNFIHAYEIYANATSTKTGTFTKQSNGSTTDRDRYKVFLQSGITKIQVNGADYSYPGIELYNPYQTYVGGRITSNNSNSYTIVNNYTGTHFIDFIGDSGSGWRSYNYTVSNKPASSLYANATSTCNQGSIALSATYQTGYSYNWYKDGIYVTTTNVNYFNASTTANGTSTYTVKTTWEGVTIDGLNSWTIKDYSIPTPTLTASLGGISTTSSLNICNGTGVVLSTNCGASTNPLWQNYATSATLYVNATTTTNYTVQCSNYFCTSSNSPPVRIINEPNIQSVKTGNWQAPDTWSCYCVPINCQNVTVQTGHTVSVPVTDAKAKNVTVRGILNFQNPTPSTKGKVGLGGS